MKTLFDKVWEKHVIVGNEGEAQLLYIDLHLIHEVTSPQAFPQCFVKKKLINLVSRYEFFLLK